MKTVAVNRNATGRRLGAYKTAAKRCGVTLDEWFSRIESGMRRCFRCRKWKSFDEFATDRSRTESKASSCKECVSDASTASRYGMTIKELLEFREAHEHKCAICGGTKTIYIDHDHVTGVVRGLLCPKCNSAIGQLNEDPTLFASALAYLEKHHG